MFQNRNVVIEGVVVRQHCMFRHTDNSMPSVCFVPYDQMKADGVQRENFPYVTLTRRSKCVKQILESW